jgi:hypothetical protein
VAEAEVETLIAGKVWFSADQFFYLGHDGVVIFLISHGKQ